MKVGSKTPNFTSISAVTLNMSPTVLSNKNLKFSTLQKHIAGVEPRDNELFARNSFSIKNLKINRSTSAS